jgi:hypothetical protein
MIRITEIIEILRNELEGWSVDGAVNMALAEDASRLPLPAMYVGLGPCIYSVLSESTYLQEYIENFFIITCTPVMPNDDRTGKYAQDFIPTARDALMQILVNYKDLDPDSHAIVMTRDLPEKIDRARYYHRFEFRIKGRIDPDDVRPLDLDVFDTLFAEYVVDEATDDTPAVEETITPIYYTVED